MSAPGGAGGRPRTALAYDKPLPLRAKLLVLLLLGVYVGAVALVAGAIMELVL